MHITLRQLAGIAGAVSAVTMSATAALPAQARPAERASPLVTRRLPPRLWRALAPGPHAVGFTARLLHPEPIARPVQLSLWYPARRSVTDVVMPFGTYVALYDPRARLPRDSLQVPVADDSVIGRYHAGWFPSAPRANVAHLTRTPTAAHWRATPAAGRWPVILYATGLGGTPLTHSVSAEYLASHGYVVAMVPALAADGGEQTYDVAGQVAMVNDLRAVWQSLEACAHCDLTRVATVGFSFGSNIALRLAQALPDVRAVASLDGSLTFHDGFPILQQDTAFVVARATQPLLAVTTDSSTAADLALLRALPSAPTYRLVLRAIAHHDVIASPVIASVVTGALRPEADAALYVTLTVLRTFLDSAVNSGSPLDVGDRSAIARMSPGFARVERIR